MLEKVLDSLDNFIGRSRADERKLGVVAVLENMAVCVYEALNVR